MCKFELSLKDESGAEQADSSQAGNKSTACFVIVMFNFTHYTNIFGYSTTQLYTVLFPSQFFIYNYTKVLVSQSSLNTITVCIY